MIINSKPIREDIAIIRESQIRMEEDVKHHIRRTDALESMVKPMHKIYIALKFLLVGAAFLASLTYAFIKIANASEISNYVNLLESVSKCKIYVTSEYRDPGHNAEIGGAPASRHVTGTANDVVTSNCEIAYLKTICDSLFLRCYDHGDHLHIDTRFPEF